MDHKLTDMKRTQSDKVALKEMYEPSVVGEGDDYSYNLNLHLGKEELEKLGISGLEVGTTVMITAEAKVTSFSEEEREEGTERRAELQIQKMDIVQDSGDAVKALYGDGATHG